MFPRLTSAAEPLHAQMTGRGYRRLTLFGRLLVLWWPAYFIAAPMTLVLGVFISSTSQGTRAYFFSPLQLVLHALLVATLLFGGGYIAPSNFARWLVNTARRGFLRDLYLSRLGADDILAAHFRARVLTVASATWLTNLYFAGNYLGEWHSTPGSAMAIDLGRVVVAWPLLMGLLILFECDSYRRSARNNEGLLLRWGPLAVAWAGYVIFAAMLLGAVLSAASSAHLLAGRSLDYELRQLIMTLTLAIGFSAIAYGWGGIWAGLNVELVRRHWGEMVAFNLARHERCLAET